MEQLKSIYSLYDMVCEAPAGGGVELVEMPAFFDEKKGIEADYAHVHNFYEIVWFKTGGGVHYVDFNEYPVLPNTIFFISPGQVHTFDKKHDHCGYVMKVCADLLNDTIGEDVAYLQYDLFNADSVPFHCITHDDAAHLDLIINALRDESQQRGRLGHKEYLRSLIRLLIIRIERGRSGMEAQALNHTKPSHRTFLAFRREVERNFRQLHTVKEYASLLGVSTKTLTNYVAECSPLSPLEIINGRIVLEAKRMLRYSDFMVKEIGYNLGFDDASYFVKFFKRRTGMLPADFRTEYIKEGAR
ncbi:helix-turn-helix domain-containing protein [Sodaliphilus sp.]|uniref:helix-turn-helix domain-containing protein n=1 Tax=Sodaliphilus sp. TaxID=2815818 RepID=UPI003890C495